jgi:asparagine synthase (glutamine-hydrolysing)
MAHSIEVRSPFLDYRVVEWAARLPRGVLINNGVGKQPLRKIAQRLLPDKVCRSRKHGFTVPLDDWFRQEPGAAFAAERLLSTTALSRGWWDGSGVRMMLESHKRRTGRPFGDVIWRLLMLDAWARHYVDSAPSVRQPRRTQPSSVLV